MSFRNRKMPKIKAVVAMKQRLQEALSQLGEQEEVLELVRQPASARPFFRKSARRTSSSITKSRMAELSCRSRSSRPYEFVSVQFPGRQLCSARLEFRLMRQPCREHPASSASSQRTLPAAKACAMRG